MQNNQTWSLEGQDKILDILFRKIKKGIYIDIGCNHAVKQNNTYRLYKKGWKGIGIDGSNKFKRSWKTFRKKDLFLCEVLSNKRENKIFYNFSDDTSSSIDLKTVKRYKKRLGQPKSKKNVYTRKLEEILIQKKIPKNFDLLCIDVEGHDLQVLKGLNLNLFKPKVIMIEIRFLNLNKPYENKIFSFLRKYKYSLIAKTPYDSIFVKKNENLGWIPKELY